MTICKQYKNSHCLLLSRSDNIILIKSIFIPLPPERESAEDGILSDYIAEKTGFRVQFDIEQLKPDLNVDATDRFQQQNLEDVLVD
ncbi:hypothetical protein B4U36_18575 [Klebsiella pneumoniae]|nr:hypothetical protein B4U36_18575 [Klebsiella pneumoniae]